MKAAHSRSRTTIAVVFCLAPLGLLGLAANSFSQLLPKTYIEGYLGKALAALPERESLPSPLQQYRAPTGFRSAFSEDPASPYGTLDRSPSPPSRTQTPINEPNKPAADSPAGSVAAQPPGAAPAQPSAPDVVTPAPRGISDKEIRFGIVAPFSGSAKELGRQMKFGIETVFSLVNDTGGINGHQLKLFLADDGYEPSRTGEAGSAWGKKNPGTE
jgi:Periplasmic binding protein